MSLYYNTTRGPLAVTLSSGKAMTCPPKSWVEIDRADEGSASLAPLIRKGYLKRSALPTPAPEAAPVAVPAPVPASEAAPVAAPAAPVPAVPVLKASVSKPIEKELSPAPPVAAAPAEKIEK